MGAAAAQEPTGDDRWKDRMIIGVGLAVCFTYVSELITLLIISYVGIRGHIVLNRHHTNFIRGA